MKNPPNFAWWERSNNPWFENLFYIFSHIISSSLIIGCFLVLLSSPVRSQEYEQTTFYLKYDGGRSFLLWVPVCAAHRVGKVQQPFSCFWDQPSAGNLRKTQMGKGLLGIPRSGWVFFVYRTGEITWAGFSIFHFSLSLISRLCVTEISC